MADKTLEDVIQEFDELFLKTAAKLTAAMVEQTGDSVVSVLTASDAFGSFSAPTALTEFHDLYFGSPTVAHQKKRITADVNELVEAVQTKVETTAPEDLDAALGMIEEDEGRRDARLSLAGLETSYETLLSLDVGVRQKLVPAMLGMQSEELVSQAMNRLPQIWLKAVKNKREGVNADTTLEQVKKMVRTKLEKTILFVDVLNEAPPAPEATEESWLESLLE